MKVYIAAPFAARDRLRGYASELAHIGIGCTSSWLSDETEMTGAVGTAPALSDADAGTACREDLSAIDAADVVVQFTGTAIEALRIPGACGPVLHSGGRHVELGYALALNKPVLVIGSPENIFQRTLCTVVRDWHSALLALAADHGGAA